MLKDWFRTATVNFNSYWQNNLNTRNEKLWTFTSNLLLLCKNVCIDGEINKFLYVVVHYFLNLRKHVKNYLSFKKMVNGRICLNEQNHTPLQDLCLSGMFS